jgi:hypothetical protein
MHEHTHTFKDKSFVMTSSTRTSEDSIALEDTSMASGNSTIYDSIEDGSFDGDLSHDNPRTSLGRLLRVLGRTTSRRKGRFDYDAVPTIDERKARLRSRSHAQRPLRTCRRAHVLGFARRALFASPFLVLMAFGVLHILTVLVGRAKLFWNVEVSDDFLPGWGKPGHIGEGLSKYPTDATRDVLPLPCHSHNDYWRRIPFYDAIHWGCTGVEADVWLFDEELYVGHNLAALTRNRTFTNLYVNPILDMLDHMNPTTDFANITGHGIFDVDPDQTLVLLVDFKTDGKQLLPVVSRQLEALRAKDYLTYWDGSELHSRAVTVVATGNAPFKLILEQTKRRDIFFDAPLDKLWEGPRNPERPSTIVHSRSADTTVPIPDNFDEDDAAGPSEDEMPVGSYNITNSYYASVSFTKTIGFVWRGHLSPRQMELIRGQIRGAKRRGLKARYWDTPSWPVAMRNHIWHVLMKEGADVLNVDDLKAAAVDQWKARVHHWW